MKYEHALSPIILRSLEIKNRIVRTAHGTTIGSQEPGTIGPAFIAYHLARAKGGVGLSLLEVCSVHPSCYGPMRSYDPGIADGYKRLVEAVAPTGMKMMQQLWHAGFHGRPVDGSPPWGPSENTSPLLGVPGIAMTRMMINELVEAYARSAKIALDNGIDGIEIHGGHSYLVQQFLSPVLNQREDDYGGSLENRMRFLMEVLTAVRAELGEERPLSIRLSADGMAMSAEESQQVLAAVEASGLIDMINISRGSYYDMHSMIPTMAAPSGYHLPVAEVITRETRLPRLVTGRFRTLEEADQLIRLGQADMVSMVRATIADPELVNKSAAGREEDVRPCIGCNQACIANVMRGGLSGMMPMSCAVNPTTGLETRYQDDVVETAEKPKRILVVGGGPAGMEAARVSALKGHQVVLVEAAAQLGGQMQLAKKAPFRLSIGDITDWQERQLSQLGVEVKLNTYMEAGDITAENADEIIIATGSMPPMDGAGLLNPGAVTEGATQPHVKSSHEIMSDTRLCPGGTAIVSDDVGHYESIAVAETLLARGAGGVVFVTRCNSMAPQMEFTYSAEQAKKRLHATGRFRVIPNSAVRRIEKDKVVLATVYGSLEEIVEAEMVVLVSFNRSNNDIYEELKEQGTSAHLIGDALSPRYLETAIREANFTARGL
ncbi:MAG: FAD-dependent oxidoreductase [Halieaceae bacterium]|nr:FAD-dependent oxidoreductase [Halieaceae bacterium]